MWKERKDCLSPEADGEGEPHLLSSVLLLKLRRLPYTIREMAPNPLSIGSAAVMLYIRPGLWGS